MRLRHSLGLLAGLVLLGTGCGGDQVRNTASYIFQSLVGSHLSVGFPSAIPVPDEVTLDFGIKEEDKAARLGAALFAAVAGETMEQKVGRAVKSAALPVREMAAGSFRKELEAAQLFGKVVNDGGDLALSLGVPRWGLRRNRDSGAIEPVFDMEASLSLPGVGKVWSASRSAAQVSQAVKDKGFDLGLEMIAAKPRRLSEVLSVVSADLSRQLVQELRDNPPKRRILAGAE